MKLRLLRFRHYADRTLGILEAGNLTLTTLEPAWKNNEKNVSCVPVGIYKLKRRNTPRFGDHLILEDVPGRSYVLIHFGNFPENTSGCILVGDGFKDLNNDKKTDITNSRSAMRMLLNEIGPSCELELLIEEVN